MSWKRAKLVVLREVGVPDDVRGDERVLGERVRVHEEGAARVAREHDFEDLRMPHALAHELVDVAHAEGPVRHADRQAVDGDFGHQALRRELEVDRVIVEPLALREPLDALGVLLQFSHGRYSLRACSVKNSRIARQMSSWLPRWLTPTGAPRAELIEGLGELRLARPERGHAAGLHVARVVHELGELAERRRDSSRSSAAFSPSEA